MAPKSISWYLGYAASAFPLDMSQYSRLFFSTRIPRPIKDELVTDDTARHIAVLRNGHFYVFDVINSGGEAVTVLSHALYVFRLIVSFSGHVASTAEIYHQLSEIASDQSPPADFPIAVLTSEERDTWALVREELAMRNSNVLKLIDSSVFLLCLDDEDPSTPESLAHSLLHGNGANRSVLSL